MTATASEPTTTDTWNQQLAQLRARYKYVREPILVALNILLHDQDISVDDSKARAAQHGARITAASVSAARTLLSRMDNDKPAGTTATTNSAATQPTRPRPARRVRPADGHVDADALIRQVVAKLQSKSDSEAERVRDGIRRAITILQGLIEP
jgi:hypothetical protein